MSVSFASFRSKKKKLKLRGHYKKRKISYSERVEEYYKNSVYGGGRVQKVMRRNKKRIK